ncbi:MAG: 2Fe-2S iron-sulfur cluster-binding protein [Treponema sp.]|nr:2Fe-2S iron-sulfur cluster-binding protein [Treponema sp.]
MKLPVILNGSKTELEASPDTSLMSVLRKYSFSSIKCGCNEGHCGSCAILLDDEAIASCKIPFGIIKDSDIVTLDYFSRSKEYTVISQGFELAGIKLCGYCNAGKYFTAYHIIKQGKILTKKEIENQIKNLSPCCTDLNTLVKGIIFSNEIYINGYEATKKKYQNTLRRAE